MKVEHDVALHAQESSLAVILARLVERGKPVGTRVDDAIAPARLYPQSHLVGKMLTNGHIHTHRRAVLYHLAEGMAIRLLQSPVGAELQKPAVVNRHGSLPHLDAIALRVNMQQRHHTQYKK